MQSLLKIIHHDEFWSTSPAMLLVLVTQVHSNTPGKWFCDDDVDEDNKLLSEYAAPDI